MRKYCQYFIQFMLVLMVSQAAVAGWLGDKARFENAKKALWQQKVASHLDKAAELKAEYDNRALTFKDKTMKFSLEKIGAEPENGYPLYIALHGGGSGPAWMNDSQWEDMQKYYRDSVTSGIYVATRGVTDTWNLHFVQESYPLYDKLIEATILFDHVDPNRIYILGFSAGGDGVYQITPRMSERFAAANMSAGHNNQLTFDNLYNTPFLLQVGENDKAYNRNRVAAENNILLNELNKTYGGGYQHDIFIHYNGTHNSWKDNDATRALHTVMANPIAWLDGDETTKEVNSNAIDWISQYTRQAQPRKIVWDLHVAAPSRTYATGSVFGSESLVPPAAPYMLNKWLDVSTNVEYPGYGKIVAELDPASNTVHIDEIKNVTSLRILLNPDMLDLNYPVTVVVGQDVVGKIRVKSEMSVMLRTMLERLDIDQVYSAEINLTYNQQAKHWVVS